MNIMCWLQVAKNRTFLPIVKHDFFNSRKVRQLFTISEIYCVLLGIIVISSLETLSNLASENKVGHWSFSKI
jgi:hypothetical protein